MIHDVHPSSLIEVAGVFCAALAGGLSGVRKHLDAFGVLVIAWVAGLGGGILRDVLIGAIPPVGISQWHLVVTALIAGVVIFFFHPRLEAMRRIIIVFDAGALALFVVVGTAKAMNAGVGPLASLIVGAVTGVGGGVLRDLLTSEVPLVLQDRQYYAIPALVGAGAAVLAGVHPTLIAQIAIVTGVLGFRLLALRLGWAVPRPPGPRRPPGPLPPGPRY